MTVSDGKDSIGNPDSDTDDTVTMNIEVEDFDEPPDALTNVTVSTNAENPTTALDVNLGFTGHCWNPRARYRPQHEVPSREFGGVDGTRL